MTISSVVLANMIAGFGTGCIFVPLTTLAVGTLRNEQIGNASSLQNLIRNTGGSIGLSFVATLLQRYSQAHQSMMVAQLSPLNPEYETQIAVRPKSFRATFQPAGRLGAGARVLFITRCCNSPTTGRL